MIRLAICAKPIVKMTRTRVVAAYVIGTAIPAPYATEIGMYVDTTTSGAAAAVTISTMWKNLIELLNRSVDPVAWGSADV